jgi:SAM-dependent methyltransferase
LPETTVCNLCGSDDTKLRFQLRDYRLYVDDALWNVVECRRCGLGYLNPRPTPEEVTRYYPPEYFARRGSFTRRYERLARHVPLPPGRLLDVGTARGDFLALMRDQGWDVVGIESSSTAGNPHGLTIHNFRFPEESMLDSDAFDVITAWAVFEHLHDPARAFAECERMLRPGGRLLVQVPNLRSLQALSRLEDVPRHLYFFSEETLHDYGRRVGLSTERVSHVPEIHGGSGRGVLRFALLRALGRSTDDFFEIYRSSRSERFQRWPLLAAAWTTTAVVERVIISDWAVRTARISGQLIATFAKPWPNDRDTESKLGEAMDEDKCQGVPS